MAEASVLIADDHIVVRLGLRSLIESQPDMRVAGEVSNAIDAVAEFERERPSISILDLRMPGGGGIEALRRIRSMEQNARILILSSFGTEEEIYQTLNAGALGYVRKNVSGEVLLQAIREVNAGRQWIPADIAERYAIRKLRPELTTREMEVLRLIFEGLTNKEIAHRIEVAENTVKNHINNLMAKLTAKDRTQAAHLALERGLLLPDWSR